MSYTASYIVNSSSAQGTTDFQFTFPYIKEEHIEVYLNYTKITQGSGSNQYQVITNVSPKLIRLNTGIASANLRVEVRRNSSLGSPLVDYADGSTLTANDLDTSALQSLYIDQELKDNQGKTVSVDEATGLPTLNNLRLTNVGDPTAAQDAATKNYVDTNFQDKSAKLTELATMAQNTANALADLTEAEVQAIDGLTASTDELNKLDGVTATTTELNYVDGVTSNVQTQLDAKQPLDAELTELATMGSTTASALADLTQAEVQILDGATVTTDELNKLDGVTASTTELNYVDGVTSNVQTQLDAKQPLNSKLTGLSNDLTATTAELNKLDGVTATTDELNKTDGLLATPTELNTLDGITSNTSELNKLDGVTASTTELNIVAGKTFKTSSGTLDTTSDTEIPSSKVIAAHVASSQTAIGGFTTIADEVSFPNTQPATGVVVSINNAAGVVINSSGVSTSGKRVDNTTVTINGFPSSLNGETLAAGVGLIVVSTSTANTYSYHKILTSETDVKQLSDDINDFNSRYRIASSAPGSNNDEGDLYFDTAANKMKVYNGSAWDDVASVGSFFVNTLSSSSGTGGGSATFNGSAYRFTLSNAGQSAQQHIVSINGVVQKPNSGTSQPSEGFAIDSNDIIFSAAPASGSDFFIVTCGSSVSIGTPSANSVNSSHIIDGSIVDGDISSSADIALSKLNTTGTANNTVYLRGDGAWTNISTQFMGVGGSTVSGNYNFQDGNSDTYLTIKHTDKSLNYVDDASAIWGTGSDLNISHDSTTNKSLIQATNSNPLEFQLNGGDLNFTYVAGGSTHTGATWDAGGAWSFAHGSSTKLATTSTGIDVTGEIKVNGAALSAAPEITATADGAIAAGQAVIMKSDGDVTKVKRVITVNNPPSSVANARTSLTTNNFDKLSSLYIPELKKIIVAGKNENSGDDLEIIVGEVDDTGAFTWGSITQIDTDRLAGDPGLVYDPSTQRLVVLYYCDGMSSPEYSIFSKVITLDGNSISDIGSRTTLWNQDGGSFWGTKLVYDPDNQKIVAVYRRGGGNNAYSAVGTVTGGSTNTVSWGTPVQIASDEIGMLDATYDPDTNRVLAVARGPSNVIDSYVGTVSGTSISWGSTSEVLASNGNYPQICYDTENQKVVVSYQDANSDAVAKVGTVTGGSTNSISWGSASSAWTTNSQGSNSSHRIKFDSYTKRVVVHCIGKGSDYRLLVASGQVSGSSVTFTNFVQNEQSWRVTETNANTFVVAEKGRVASIYRAFDYNNDLYSTSCVIGTGASNMTTTNFVGFAKAAANDNATTTVDVTGSTNSSQSSLTPGLGYYIQDDGTLGTTASDPEQFAGTAISATKLLVRGYPPATAGVGEWTKLLSGNKAYSTGTHDFVEGFDTTYAAYKWFKIAWHFVGDGGDLGLGVRVKSGGSYQGNNQYNVQNTYQNNASTWGANNNGSNNQPAAMFNGYYFDNAQGETQFFNPMSTTIGCAFVSHSEGWSADSGSGTTGTLGTGFRGRDRTISSWGTNYGAITGLQWYVTSTNIRNMYWVLYGRN